MKAFDVSQEDAQGGNKWWI